MCNNSIAFFIFACFLALSAQVECAEPGKFVAVVTEFHPWNNTNRNTLDYEDAITTTKDVINGDIVVFPERTLTVTTKDAEYIPDPKDNVIPYKNGTYNKRGPMFRVSKAAAENKVYTVVNLFEKANCTNSTNCPDRGYFIYDTNVAFDRQGTVIARYRKYNVYSGNQADKPDKPELSTFTTDFGQTFGMFTGFDILFKTPSVDLVQQKKVKNIVFPSRWPGELPFLTAVQVQDGWSQAMNVTLLASGANSVQSGCTGSGVYIPGKHKKSNMYEYSGSCLLYAGVVTKGKETGVKSGERALKLLEDPSIPRSRGKDLDPNDTKFSEKICHGGLCCSFNVTYKTVSETATYKYRAVVFEGVRKFGGNLSHEVAYCGLVLCTDGNCAKKPGDGNYPLEFREIKIDANFRKVNTLQFPSTLVWTTELPDVRLKTLPYDDFRFEKKDLDNTDLANVSICTSSKLNKLVTFGIYGRKFD